MDGPEERDRISAENAVSREGENLASRKRRSRSSRPLFENRKGKEGFCANASRARDVPSVGGPDDEWLTAEEAAAYLKMPLGTLRNKTSNGSIPHYKPSGSVRYSRLELMALLLANARGRKSWE